MAKAKDIGVDSTQKRQCAYCSEPFDGPEFWSFLLQRDSRTFICMRCDNENYFVKADKGSKIGLMFLFIVMLISLTPVILGLLWVAAFYLGYIDVLWLWAPIGAAVLTSLLIRIAIKVYRWHFYKVQNTLFELKMDFT